MDLSSIGINLIILTEYDVSILYGKRGAQPNVPVPMVVGTGSAWP